MPRYLVVYDGCTVHVTWQCHNKSWFLESDKAKQTYYDLLLKYKSEYAVSVHSYSFMSSHPHLTMRFKDKEGFSAFFRIVNCLFAKKHNKDHRRRGQVVMDRFKSPLIESDEVQMHVMIYGDLNQVRAEMVKHPREWKWSSFAHYAYGKKDPLIDDAPCYIRLGKTKKARQRRYRKLVDKVLWEECIRKQNYSAVYFIGNPDWVDAKIKELREKEREAYRKLERQKRKREKKKKKPPG